MTVEVASSDQLLEFIFNISKSFQELPSSSKNVFDSPENESLCQNFLKSTSAGTIYVIKLKHENNDSFQVTEDLKDLEGCLSIIALIKSNEPISSIKSFDSQLHILNIPVDRTTKTLTSETNIEGNESESNSSRKFESIRSLINLGVSPYFDLITSKEQNDSISVVRKKFNELSLTLQHLQQKIHIPDLISSTHPVIVEYLLASASATSDEIVDSIPLTTLQDTSFLNQLTTIVNGWVKQIQAITKLNHSPLDGKSVIEEILFWKSMDESLNSLNQQISQREIQTTIEILKRAKRYHITISFNNETGLEDKIIETQNYSSILKDFPIDELLSSDITTLKRSVNIIFNHLKKLKNLASYPLLRSIELIEVVLNDITTKFIDIVSSSVYLMSLPMDQFLDYYNQNLNGIFEAIDMDIKSMINLIRELLRKRQEKFMIIKINQDNLNSWKSSLENLKDFRLGHTNLIKTCEILGKSDEKLIEAYNQYIIPINVCDMTTGGINVWKSNESLYMNVFEDVKKVVIIEINELFDTCNNFNEFLNLFKRFRGREDQELEHEGRHFVLSFISEEHKLRCMNIVEEEIQAIHIKNRKHSNIIINSLQPFTGYYNDDIVGKIIWLMSIHKSAKFYLSNLNQLFGDNWDQYSTGNKINNELKSLLKIGNPEEIAAQWMESIQFDLELLGPILSVRVSEEDDDTTDYLHVNFDSTNIQLIDQLKQLSNLGFRIPTSIASKLHVIDKIYPFVKDLTDSVNILNDILNRELTSQTLYGVRYAFLVTSQKSLVFELVEECSKVTWTILAQAFDLQKGVEQQNVQDLSNLIESKSLLSLKSLLEQVYVLYGKVNSIREFVVSFEGQLNDLEIDCPYQQSDITRRLLEISDLVTRTCYEDFDKIDLLYELVNIEIEEVLQRKCERELDTFQKSIRSQNLFAEKKLTISLSFQDQIFSFNPDINSYKKTWFDKINDIISTVSNNYLINCENEKKFTSIFEKISLEVLKCYIEIDDIISEANEYLAKWETLQFQWETSTQELEKQFGNKSNNESLLLWIKKLKKSASVERSLIPLLLQRKLV